MKGLRRVRLVWRVVAGCGLALLVVALYASFRGWTPGEVERLVNRELPPGSDRAAIEAFLDGQGWPWSCGGPENRFYAEWAKLSANEVREVKRVVSGKAPDPNVGPLTRGPLP